MYFYTCSDDILERGESSKSRVLQNKNAEKKKTNLELRLPICVDPGQRVSLSRRIGSRWRLIGYGIIH